MIKSEYEKIFYIFSILSTTMVFSQKYETKIADRYQSKQPQDLSIPHFSCTFPRWK